MKTKHLIQMAGGMILCLAIIFNIHNRPAPSGALRNSEALGYDEFPITCAPDPGFPAEAGFPPQIVADVLPSNAYALNSAFITAAALNYTNNNPVYWADTYYNNPQAYYYNTPNGAMYRDDLITWWGSQTFSPMSPIAPDFCLIWECMDDEFTLTVSSSDLYLAGCN